MRRFGLLLLILSLLIPQRALAGVWGERGVSKQFAVDGDRLYAADGRGIAVYDISEPSALRRTTVISGDDESLDVAPMGASDLLLATTAGVERFAVAEDGALIRLGRWGHDGGIEQIAATVQRAAGVLDNELFILERKGVSLRQLNRIEFNHPVLDLLATPTHFVAAVDQEGIYVIDADSGTEVAFRGLAARAVALSGTTVWVASAEDGLIAVDIEDPTAPTIRSRTGSETLALDGVAASGTRVFAFRLPDTLYFFDATDIEAPRLVATRTEWVDLAAANGPFLFFSGRRRDRDGFTYETGLPIRLFDASDPASPRLAGEVRDLAGPVSGVWTDGSLAYVIDAPFFRVLDVSKTDQPREITSIELPFHAPQLQVRVKNGIALVYGRDFVHLVDVSDPVRPRLKTSWNPQGHSPDDAALMADGLFVELNMHSGIHVVDYARFEPPRQVGGRVQHWHHVAAGDDAIYALANTFLTMSVTDRSLAQDVTVIRKSARSIDTAPPNVDRPPLIVLRQTEGLRTYSLVEDRFSPREIAFTPLFDPGEMATSETSVVVDVGGTLHRMEFSDPTEVVSTNLRVTSAMQISIAGQKIVVADRYRVRVYGPDTAPPPNPVPPRRRAVRR